MQCTRARNPCPPLDLLKKKRHLARVVLEERWRTRTPSNNKSNAYTLELHLQEKSLILFFSLPKLNCKMSMVTTAHYTSGFKE